MVANRLSSLRVALIAPPWFEVPPTEYGGIEAMLASLADGLADLGHDVLLVAAGRAGTRARYAPTYDDPPSALLGNPVPEVVQAAAAARLVEAERMHGRPIDIVHDHTLAGPLLARGRGIPTVVTMHGPVVEPLLRYYRELGDSIGLVAISNAQRILAPDLPWVGTIHHGIDVDSFTFRADKEDHAVWLGRYCPDKAPHLAIDAARAAGVSIRLAGKLSEPPERRYFETEIKHRLGPDAVHLGMVGFQQKCDLLASARCVVCPIRWDEPFGLVMVEAMACGTPVVALRRGSVPELILDGVTGFICDSPDELPDAIREAKSLDPSLCRKHVEDNFGLDRMLHRYERLYSRLLARGPRTPTPPVSAVAV